MGNLILADGRNLGRELVGSGYAWWFHKYSKDASLGKLEAEARKKRIGLWVDADPVTPWEWCDRSRNKNRPTIVVPNGIEIAALLPDPKGRDAGHEQVTITNGTDTDVDLNGWRLQDHAGNRFSISGQIHKRGKLVVTMTKPSMPLNNNGDEVWLIDPDGVARSTVAYDAEQVRAGAVLLFEK